ncbi:MAG: LCP family protein [Clostridiales bacterium]|nr:LCP family protein [Clostridiales bacterium]
MSEPGAGQKNNKRKKTRPAKSASRRIFNSLLFLLGAVLLLIAGRSAYVVLTDPARAFETPRPIPTVAPTLAPNATPAPTPLPTPTLSPEELLRARADSEFTQNKVNILLLGWDQSPEREDKDSDVYRDENNNYRSDVIMLLAIDFESGRVDLVSIPRDTYAPIYNTKGRWKINAAFAKGGSAEGEGFLYAMNTVSDLLGVPIHYYVGVDMEGLKAVVNAMGGVDYDVDIKITLNGRVLEKGYQRLDGQQVLDYCRARKGISTDVGRNDRQQRILFAIFEQMKSRDQLVNIPKIYASVQDRMRTNLNTGQIASLVVFALSIDMDDLHRHTLAGEYVSGVYNASFYVLNNSKLKALIKEIYGVDVSTNKRYDVGYVRADKAASAATAYLSGAEYLLATFSGATGADTLQSAYEELQGAAERSISSGGDALFDESAIESAQHKLYSAMLYFCRQNNITKDRVDKSRLPSALYNNIPDGESPALSNTDVDASLTGGANAQ